MAEPAARFRSGDRVRVRALEASGHVRTPGYLRGRIGRVSRVHGAFRTPESLAYGGDGLPVRTLYQVCFVEAEVWPRYGGPRSDSVYADIYEQWLEAP